MATVRITQEIRQEVRRKIESLFDARIKKKYEELQHLDVAMQVFMRRIITSRQSPCRRSILVILCLI